MRIAVDARQIFRPDRRGIGKTEFDLLRTLARMCPEWHFDLYHRTPHAENPFIGCENVFAHFLEMPGDRWELWERIRLPIAAWRADLLHCPANTGPGWCRTPVVLTIHDLIPLDETPHTSETRRWLRSVKRAARIARHITAPSEYTRSRVLEVLGIAPERVTVIPHGPTEGIETVADAAQLRAVQERYGLAPGERYFFAFGAADPRKNTAGVIEAFARIPPPIREQVRLLIVGVQSHAMEAFRELTQREAVENAVILCRYLPDADLPALLSGAVSLVFPSRNEGFGVPILDAFACGTPVITGNRTSLPEVAGDAALLVNPEDPAAIAEAMVRFLTSESLRAEHSACGRVRLSDFSWKVAAERLRAVYAAAVSRG